MNNKSVTFLLMFLLGTVLFLLRCTSGPTQVAGGSSDTEVCGIVIDTAGQVVNNAKVVFLPVDFNPAEDDPIMHTYVDTTDAAGEYAIPRIDTGQYNVYAEHLEDGRKLLRRNVQVQLQKNSLSPDTLKRTGKVSIAVRSQWDGSKGYIFVEGTPLFGTIDGSSPTMVLDSVPAQVLPAIYYGEKNGDPRKQLISQDGQITVVPGRTVPAGVFAGWDYMAQISINTTISGANISQDIHDFPLFIRLNRDNFSFSEAAPDGRDIRFSNSHYHSLPYQIERWDSEHEFGEVWVLVDTIRGNSDSQSIRFFWGNDNAADSSSGQAVFNSANGFEGVWHLSESDVGTRYDATDNANHAEPVNYVGEEANPWGAVGGSDRFGPSSQPGESRYLQANDPGITDGVGDQFTMSAWIEMGTTYPAGRFVLSKANEAGDGYAYAVFFDEDGNIGGQVNGVSTAFESKMMMYWNHVVLRYDGSYLSFWLNGMPFMPVACSGALASTQADLFIGSDALGESGGYEGGLDEVRVSSVARSNEWIRLCFQNQSGQPFVHINY
ncbi:MAG: DUF2341 domain-containing protein [Chitinivibrionales bacterium]